MDIAGWPVMKRQCSTCPFRPKGDVELASQVLQRSLMKASQICHHPKLKSKKEIHLCRGARDMQLTVLHRLGWIEEPTDECFKKASEFYLSLASAQTPNPKEKNMATGAQVYESLTDKISDELGSLSEKDQKDVIQNLITDLEGILDAMDDDSLDEVNF